jgi:hypothetical protein
MYPLKQSLSKQTDLKMLNVIFLHRVGFVMLRTLEKVVECWSVIIFCRPKRVLPR